ncbi:MAG: alpha-galactosidase [Lachnospiraceae bacterium]|nr:alpha-galactosidase [Lachnospiraceae bacterium]
MIKRSEDTFILSTENTTYAFRILKEGIAEHIYYGRRINLDTGAEALFEKQEFAPGNNAMYVADNPALSLNNLCTEISGEGKGDMRQPFIRLVRADGSRTSDLIYESAEITKGKPKSDILPVSHDETGEVDRLRIIYKDRTYGERLCVDYCVFEKEDVITKNVTLTNEGDTPVRIDKLMSSQLDLHDPDHVLAGFRGGWAREMRRIDTPLIQGRTKAGSMGGSSSNTANPFFMLYRPKTDEDSGDVYGFNLIYSGNHEESIEVNEFGKVRVLWGINHESFEYMLDPGESFEAPEAVMTFSHEGFNGMSYNMHRFVTEHILSARWKDEPRPILLNSWEAAYFNINESRLLKLASAAKNVGIELFVMDDGWFGERNDDTASLGDWEPNKKKLGGGIKSIADKVNALGLKFGLWVEPEMVNVKSRLYEEHPDWTLEIPGAMHSEGRNQRILDLSKPEVCDHIIEAMTKTFSSGNVSYVKWDYNRNFTDVYSQDTEPMRQGGTGHAYILGLYRIMRTLTERFPDILFEGCASGGNRFDLGILSYFPQIWGSDNTDAICRAEIQNGYSYGYPLCTVGAHVSAVPNHQTLRNTPMSTRFNVAAFGALGYELNLCDATKEELNAIRFQIILYKQWREVFNHGRFYRGRRFGSQGYGNTVLSQNDGNVTEWTVVSPDKDRAVGMLLQKQAIPNHVYMQFNAKGLDKDKLYHFYNYKEKLNIMDFGDLVNTVAPVHIKNGSSIHKLIAKIAKMESEEEHLNAYGDTLMYGGVRLKPAFGGTGLNENVRPFGDYASRMYFIEEETGSAD